MADQERNDVLFTEEVRELVALIKNTDIAEVLIERGDAKLHIKRALPQPPTLAPVLPAAYGGPAVAPPAYGGIPQAVAPAQMAVTPVAESETAEEETLNGISVTAPMVGTFYSSPSPKEPSYVQAGDEVKPGDVLGIIEAMKIMNEIECETHGRVARVLVDNGQPVEYGQVLMLIEPL